MVKMAHLLGSQLAPADGWKLSWSCEPESLGSSPYGVSMWAGILKNKKLHFMMEHPRASIQREKQQKRPVLRP